MWLFFLFFTFLIVVHVVNVQVPSPDVWSGQIITIDSGAACLPEYVVTALVLVANIYWNTIHDESAQVILSVSTQTQQWWKLLQIKKISFKNSDVALCSLQSIMPHFAVLGFPCSCKGTDWLLKVQWKPPYPYKLQHYKLYCQSTGLKMKQFR